MQRIKDLFNAKIFPNSTESSTSALGHGELQEIFNFVLQNSWKFIGYIFVIREYFKIFKFAIENTRKYYNNLYEIHQIVENIFAKIVLTSKYLRDIIHKFVSDRRYDVFFVQIINISEKNQVFINNVKNNLEKFSNSSTNIINRSNDSKFFELVNFINKIENYSYNVIFEKYSEMTTSLIQFPITFEFFGMFYFYTNISYNLKNFLNDTKSVKMILTNALEFLTALRDIGPPFKPIIFFLTNWNQMDTVFCKLDHISIILKLVSITLSNFLNALEDFVSSKKISIVKALSDILDPSNIFEIIFEHMDWQKISRMIFDIVRKYDTLFGKFLILYEESKELFNMLYMFVQKCKSFYETGSYLIDSVIFRSKR